MKLFFILLLAINMKIIEIKVIFLRLKALNYKLAYFLIVIAFKLINII